MLLPPRSPLARRVLLALVVATVACAPAFNVARFRGDNDALFAAAMAQYQQRQWDNAVAAFERLTLELPARDTLLPVSHYYLGAAHGHRAEHLLAAQAFTRLTETFPEHHLADDAVYGAARSYQKLWRKPALDASYGQTALATYRLYLAMFPSGEQRAVAEQQIAELEQDFATKEYLNGMFYLRRKYFDSAIIYFRGVVTQYPETPRAKDAWLRLVDAYRSIRYAADAADACEALRARWSTDAEVLDACPATVATPTSSPPAAPADSTARPVPVPVPRPESGAPDAAGTATPPAPPAPPPR